MTYIKSAHTQIVFAHSKPHATNLRIMAGYGHGIALQIAAQHHRPTQKPALTLRRTPPANAENAIADKATKALQQAQKKAAPKAIGTALS